MGRDRVLGLKVDVDTRKGMEEGVPALLSLLAGFGLRATLRRKIDRFFPGWNQEAELGVNRV